MVWIGHYYDYILFTKTSLFRCFAMAFKWLNHWELICYKAEIIKRVLSCRVPTVTSNLFECSLAIWYCFMSLSIKLIDPPSLSAACGWSLWISVCACNMNMVQWYDYSAWWSLSACSMMRALQLHLRWLRLWLGCLCKGCTKGSEE